MLDIYVAVVLQIFLSQSACLEQPMLLFKIETLRSTCVFYCEFSSCSPESEGSNTMLIKAKDVYLTSGITHRFVCFSNEECIVPIAGHRTRTKSITSVRSVGGCSTIPLVNIIVMLLSNLRSDHLKLHRAVISYF